MRDARIEAEPPRDAGRFLGDVGELLRVRHVVHRGVGDDDGAPAAERDRDADDAMAGLRVDAAAEILPSPSSSCA